MVLLVDTDALLLLSHAGLLHDTIGMMNVDQVGRPAMELERKMKKGRGFVGFEPDEVERAAAVAMTFPGIEVPWNDRWTPVFESVGAIDDGELALFTRALEDDGGTYVLTNDKKAIKALGRVATAEMSKRLARRIVCVEAVLIGLLDRSQLVHGKILRMRMDGMVRNVLEASGEGSLRPALLEQFDRLSANPGVEPLLWKPAR